VGPEIFHTNGVEIFSHHVIKPTGQTPMPPTVLERWADGFNFIVAIPCPLAVYPSFNWLRSGCSAEAAAVQEAVKYLLYEQLLERVRNGPAFL